MPERRADMLRRRIRDWICIVAVSVAAFVAAAPFHPAFGQPVPAATAQPEDRP